MVKLCFLKFHKIHHIYSTLHFYNYCHNYIAIFTAFVHFQLDHTACNRCSYTVLTTLFFAYTRNVKLYYYIIVYKHLHTAHFS